MSSATDSRCRRSAWRIPVTSRRIARRRAIKSNSCKRSFFTGHITQGNGHHNLLEVDLQTTFHPEPAILAGYASPWTFDWNTSPPLVTDSMIHQLATIQHADGHWSWNLPRPPDPGE